MGDLKLVVDLGNGFLKGTVFLEDENKKTNVIVREIQKTKGLRRGKILDATELLNSLNQLLEKIRRKIGDDVLAEVIVGLSHPHLVIERVKELTRILKPQIDAENVQHLLKIVEDTVYKPNYETIKIVPVYWIVDEELRVKDPTGMEGKRLELVADIFLLPKNFQQAITEIFAKLDLEVVEMVPNILAASEVALDMDSKDLGSLLVDIGHNQTSYVVFEEGYPLIWGVLPIGGEEVSKDISIGLQVDLQQAEKIKLQKGSLRPVASSEEDETLDLKFLREIIAARYEEIFEKINQHLAQIEKDGRLPGGVYLIGGGAKVDGLEDFAKGVFKLAVFKGEDKVLRIEDVSDDQMFVSSIGAYVWFKKYYSGSSGLLGFFKSGVIASIVGFFKRLFKNLF